MTVASTIFYCTLSAATVYYTRKSTTQAAEIAKDQRRRVSQELIAENHLKKAIKLEDDLYRAAEERVSHPAEVFACGNQVSRALV